MSIPVHFNGSLLNIMGGGAAAPPVITTFDTMIIHNASGETVLYFSQLYYGTETTSGVGAYTNKTTFLADQPGLTLITFSGIATPGNPQPVPPFAGVTFSQNPPFPTLSMAVEDKADSGGPYDNIQAGFVAGDLLIITFSPGVSAAGFNFAGGVEPAMTLTTKNGSTVLDTRSIAASFIPTFTTFYGYAT